jgi:TIR domain
MIFISYRRADSASICKQIYDRLANYFGGDMITMDVDTFMAGTDFRKQITDFVRQSDIVLAIIGPRWVSELQQRNDDLNDYLRIELELALSTPVQVIPFLVNGANIPVQHQLPNALQQLVYKNAIKIPSDRDFNAEMDRVVHKIEEVLIDVWNQQDRERQTRALQSTGEDRRANADHMKITVGSAFPETIAYWRNAAKILSQWAPIMDNVLGRETIAKLEDLVRNVNDDVTRFIAQRGLAGLPYQLGDERRLHVPGYSRRKGVVR